MVMLKIYLIRFSLSKAELNMYTNGIVNYCVIVDNKNCKLNLIISCIAHFDTSS